MVVGLPLHSRLTRIPDYPETAFTVEGSQEIHGVSLTTPVDSSGKGKDRSSDFTITKVKVHSIVKLKDPLSRSLGISSSLGDWTYVPSEKGKTLFSLSISNCPIYYSLSFETPTLLFFCLE